MEVTSLNGERQAVSTRTNIQNDNLNDLSEKFNGNNKNSNSESSNDKKTISEKDVKKAVDKLNKLFEDKKTHVEYEVYGKFREITISIVSDNTNKVVKEIPPKKIIDMVDKLCELAGILVDEKA